MGAAFDTFVRTRVPPPGYFTLPLAAMPSLHAAHAMLFTALAFRRFPWLGACFLVILLFILFEAVASGWHYVLDLPAGALLAGFCLWLADRLLPDTPEHTPCSDPLRGT
jgi:membrane-associated phospholipid phosphatase